MATGITISILQQYFSRLIVKFLNCTSELLIRHDRGGEIVIFRQWQPAEAALLGCKKEGLIEISLQQQRGCWRLSLFPFLLFESFIIAECKLVNLKQRGHDPL